MATTSTSYATTQNYRSHFPPSPPPSPPTRHRKRHNKKRSDSFEKLANTLLPSPTSSELQEPHKEEPLLVRIILTPILFISFILSLTLVNLRDRLLRIKSHSRSSTSLLAYLYPSAWLDLEPYQDPADSTWARRGSVAGHVEPHDAIGPREDSQGGRNREQRKTWHLNKKIRKVARLEVSDAFEMRGRVMVGMGLMLVFGVVGICFAMRWMAGIVQRAF